MSASCLPPFFHDGRGCGGSVVLFVYVLCQFECFIKLRETAIEQESLQAAYSRSGDTRGAPLLIEWGSTPPPPFFAGSVAMACSLPYYA